jgi:hypothetical protein
MWNASAGLLAVLGFLLAQLSGAAADCPCSKSQMVERYGSVSMFPAKPPGPRKLQPPAQRAPIPVSTTAIPRTDDIARALPTPAIDRIANPLAWNTLFIQQ